MAADNGNYPPSYGSRDYWPVSTYSSNGSYVGNMMVGAGGGGYPGYYISGTSTVSPYTVSPYTMTRYVPDVSYDPYATRAVPAAPDDDMAWLRRQNDAVCARSGL
jgi:hypothetical protein